MVTRDLDGDEHVHVSLFRHYERELELPDLFLYGLSSLRP